VFFHAEEIIRAGDITQVAEHLPSKHRALSSNPCTTKLNKTLVIKWKVKF
jgi:hypothetical protein